MTNSNSFDDNNDIINQQNDCELIDKIDQRLLDLLIKGYTNKKIALEAGSPLSTIQRRIRKIFVSDAIWSEVVQVIGRKKEEIYPRLLIGSRD